jgi:hypothetical protein
VLQNLLAQRESNAIKRSASRASAAQCYNLERISCGGRCARCLFPPSAPSSPAEELDPLPAAVATSRRKTLSFLRRSRALRGTERALAVAERGDDEDAAPRRSSGYARMMEEAAAAGESGRRQKKRVAGDVEQPLSSQGEEEEAEAASCEST